MKTTNQQPATSNQKPATSHQQPATSNQPAVVIVGGGIAGLIAAARLGRGGVPAVLLEKSTGIGGRAATRDREGFLFNLGPHALYRLGVLRQTLEELGVDVVGHLPPTDGGFALHAGRLHTLPVGLTSLLTTGLLGVSGKLELARIQTRLLHVDATAIRHDTFASWLGGNVADRTVHGILAMLGRVTTYTNDPDHQSAGAAIEQLQLALRGNVLYLDGGWQTIVDGLRRVALETGVRIISNAHAVGFDRSRLREVRAVRLADGSSIAASAVVIAAGPAEVDALAGTDFERHLTPIKMATLDVALRSLPKPSAKVAFGIDVPLYFSVHSASAQLAPSGGALIHVSKYLRPGERAGVETERELETLMDMMQPGWRAIIESKQFLPALTVTHAELTAAQGGAAGRPSARLESFDNVAIAGDWVGPRGQLSDAAAASAADAVAHVTAALKACTTSDSALAAQAVDSPLIAQAFRPAVGAAS